MLWGWMAKAGRSTGGQAVSAETCSMGRSSEACRQGEGEGTLFQGEGIACVQVWKD